MTRRLAGFDGLRAVAALTVLGYHVALFSGYTRHGLLAPVLSELKAGVGVFFVISGTLLYLPFARAIRDGAPLPDWHEYASRRALRIVPAYWLTLTVFMLGPFGGTWMGLDSWRFYGFAAIYKPDTLMQGLGVAWSLCVEVTFYLMLPLFAAAVWRLVRGRTGGAGARLQLLVLGAIGLVTLSFRGLAAGSVTAPIPHASATLAISLPGFLDWFAIGMALAVLASEIEAGRQLSSAAAALARRPGVCVALAVILFAAGVPFAHGDQYLPLYGLLTHIATGAASGLVVLAVAVPVLARARDSATMRLLGGPVLTWLGTISYGIYLWHVPVLRLLVGRSDPAWPLRPLSSTLLVGILTMVGAVGTGAASWYLVERPLQRLGRSRRAPAAIPAAPASPLSPAWMP